MAPPSRGPRRRAIRPGGSGGNSTANNNRGNGGGGGMNNIRNSLPIPGPSLPSGPGEFTRIVNLHAGGESSSRAAPAADHPSHYRRSHYSLSDSDSAEDGALLDSDLSDDEDDEDDEDGSGFEEAGFRSSPTTFTHFFFLKAI